MVYMNERCAVLIAFHCSIDEYIKIHKFLKSNYSCYGLFSGNIDDTGVIELDLYDETEIIREHRIRNRKTPKKLKKHIKRLKDNNIWCITVYNAKLAEYIVDIFSEKVCKERCWTTLKKFTFY